MVGADSRNHADALSDRGKGAVETPWLLSSHLDDAEAVVRSRGTDAAHDLVDPVAATRLDAAGSCEHGSGQHLGCGLPRASRDGDEGDAVEPPAVPRSEEHTSELQSLMRISYAVFCLNKKTHQQNHSTL